MKEWNSPYNPFNSMKVLMWRNHLEACAKDDYLTPVTVDVDPSGHCNYKCNFCNANDIICNDRPDLSEEHLIKLADFIKSWGADTPEGNPKSACVAGGGEPLMNKGTMAFLERMHSNGLQNGLITNGSLLNDEKIDIVAKTCRWVGFSMDAATIATYNKIKGLHGDYLFPKVCNSIQQLVKKVDDLGVKNDIAFKFLLSPDNYNEIYSAAILAKSLGVHDFHLRPVGYLNLSKTEGKELVYTTAMMGEIDKQLEEALKLESSRFHVYGVRHKFQPNFQPQKNFKRCWAIPILPTFGADGNVYLCFDMRGRKDTIMCKHYPDVTEIARFWNSEKHRQMVKNFDISTCPRCTFSAYNEMIEKVINNDDMCVNFP